MVNGITVWMRRNGLGITCAVLLAFLQILPHAILSTVFTEAGRTYHPVTPMTLGGNYPVFPHRIQEYLEGKSIITDPDLWEYRNGPWSSRPPLPALFFAVFGVAIGRPWFFPVAETASIVIIFFLLAGFLEALTGTRRWSVLWAFFLCTGSMLTAFDLFPFSREELATTIKLLSPFVWGDSWIPRVQYATVEAVIPAMIIQILFLWVLYRFTRTPNWRTAIGLGFFFGLTFYTYPFYWMFDAVALGITGCIWLFQRKFRFAAWLCVAGGIGAVMSIAFWVMFFSLHQLPQYHEILDRTSQTEFGRFVRWRDWKFYSLSFLGWILMWWCARKTWIAATLPFYFGSLFLAAAVGHNMQLLTGFTISPDHWMSRGVATPFSLLLGALLVVAWQRILRPRLRAFPSWAVFLTSWILVAYILCGAVSAQAQLAVRLAWTHLLPAHVSEVLRWIDGHIEADAVIMTPSLFLSELIPYETRARVFVPQVWNTVAPFSELRERWFITLTLVGASEEWVRASFHQLSSDVPFSLTRRLVRFGLDPRNYLVGFGYREWREVASGHHVVHLSEAMIDSFLEEYRTMRTSSVEELLHRYRADYLLLGAGDVPAVGKNAPTFSSWEQVYNHRGMVIYRIPRP